jgi:hypothetical protein
VAKVFATCFSLIRCDGVTRRAEDAEAGDGGISHRWTQMDTDGVGHGAGSLCRGGPRPVCAHTMVGGIVVKGVGGRG